MAAFLFKNIKQLIGIQEATQLLRGAELAQLSTIDNAYLLVEDDEIVEFGSMAQLPGHKMDASEVVDASGRLVMPAWCDSHTHIVFPASREDEFVDKIKGLSYAEIAARGGGILNSAR